MLFPRRSKKSNKASRAIAAACEPLESRQLLTAVVNGVFSGTNTQFDGLPFFEYRQGNGDAAIRISVTGNITAEFIGARAPVGVDEILANDDDVVLAELVPVNVATSDIFLFSIYVTKSDANCSISISEFDEDDDARPPTPFSGGQQIRIFNASTGASQLITPADGGAYIGLKTDNTLAAPNNSIPRIYANERAFGLRPSAAGQLFAGLEIAAGNNINKVFIGGTISGVVNIKRGNIETFYAGNVLTGDASGISALGNQSDLNGFNIGHFPNSNFHVGGDIRNLISANSFGTLTLTTPNTANNFATPNYKTGFQLLVDGRVGQVYGDDSFLGQAIIRNSSSFTGSGAAQQEVEVKGATDVDFEPQTSGNNLALSNDERFFNDTFDSAQWLGTSRSAELGLTNAIQLKGSLGNLGATADALDFYSVPLLAGQTIEVQLLDNFVGLLTSSHPRLGIFDPNGRLITSDYSNLNPFSRINATIQIKATIPGSYRICVAQFGDANFNGTADAATANIQAEGVVNTIPNPYELRITRAGDIAVGGMIVNQHFATLDQGDTGIQVLRGDLGEIRAGLGANDNSRVNTAVAPAQGSGQLFSSSHQWVVSDGHLRAMEAFSIGISGTLNVFGSGPDLVVRKGKIGLLHTTAAGATNMMIINDDALRDDGVTRLYPVSTDDLTLTSKSLAAGEDIQLIDCLGVLEGAYLANGGIGVIRTQILGGLTANRPVIQANVDKAGDDGVIDLIDVTFNTAGGTTFAVNSPAITTGPNGNVRYFHVATNGRVIQDQFFGGGLSLVNGEPYGPGVQVNVVDDSGINMTFTPIPRDPNLLFPLPTGAEEFLDPPQLDILTYGIRDKGGQVVLRVSVSQVDDLESDGVTNINRPGGGGVLVSTSGSAKNGGGEIGEINLTLTPAAATSNPFTFNPFTGANAGIPGRSYQQNPPPVAPAQPIRPLNLIFRGSARVDVYDIVSTAAQIINSISNETKGEIVNMTGASDVFDMAAQTIGMAKSSTGTTVEGALVRSNVFPYVNARTLINLGDVASIRSRGAIGNVQSVNIAELAANSDGKDDSKAFEGIAGVVFVNSGAANLTGNLVSARIGEGIAFDGNGLVPLAGIFSTGLIDSITGKGDIRGSVIATGITTRATQQATDVDGNALVNPDGTPLQISTPTHIIGTIRLNGGSIIEGDIMTLIGLDGSLEGNQPVAGAPEQADTANAPFYDIAAIRLEGKGGIMGANIATADLGPITIEGGFGVAATRFIVIGNNVMAGINTDGYGVRFSGIVNAASLRSVVLNGTGKAAKVTSFSSSVRQSEKSSFDAFSGMALSAFNDLHLLLGTTKSNPTRKGQTETAVLADTQFLGGRDLGKIEAYRILAHNVTTIDPNTNQPVKIPFGAANYPMQINFANSIGSINVRNQVNGLALRAGRVNSFKASGDVKNALLTASVLMKDINVGSLAGGSAIRVQGTTGKLEKLTVKKSLNGTVEVSNDVNTIKVGSDVGSKNIRIRGNLKTLSITGSVVTGAKIDVDKKIGKLQIGEDVQAGASIFAGSIGTQDIDGQVEGTIFIG